RPWRQPAREYRCRSGCRWASGSAGGSARRRSGSSRRITRWIAPPPCSRVCSTSASTTWASTSVSSTRRSACPITASPSSGPACPHTRRPVERLRRALCRAYNVFTAEQFRPFNDRIIPAAIIPVYTPEEAIEELEFCSKQLGYRVVMMGGMVRRPVPYLAEEHPDASKFVEWYDVLGLDSPHDYDPLWAKCLELKIAPSFHNGARSIVLRNSPSNFCYNHIGHFASASEATAKAIFLGGVTRRFPGLNFAFLEGGVGWACGLYADLIGHWEKRNRQALENTNPASLDQRALLAIAA